METRALPLHGKEWTTERGSLAVWLPSRSFLVLSIRGHGQAGFAAPMLAEYAKLSQASSFDLFADVQHMTSYDSPLRTELTSRFLADRDRIAHFPVLFGSKLVAMGVSVANLALGGIITSMSNRHRFIELLDECLFRRSIVGFSSNVLDAAQPPTEGQRAT
jgi:hypothetical protein